MKTKTASSNLEFLREMQEELADTAVDYGVSIAEGDPEEIKMSEKTYELAYSKLAKAIEMLLEPK